MKLYRAYRCCLVAEALEEVVAAWRPRVTTAVSVPDEA